MKSVVVYYSLSGNTTYVSQKIAESIGADLISLVPKKAFPDSGFKKFFWGGKSALMGEKPELQPYDFDRDTYDLVILGSPVWAGTFAPPLRTFIEENRAALQNKRLAAFFCCSGGPGKVLEKLKVFVSPGHLEQEIILIDPKDKPAAHTDEKIKSFCEKLH